MVTVLLLASAAGEALRTYELDLQGGKPQPLGPAGFQGRSVASDGKRVAGRNAMGDAVIFDKATQKLQAASGIAPGDAIGKWTQDGQALLVTQSTPWQAEVYRVEVATGKRSLLQKIELSDKAGSSVNLPVNYAERSKTYVYNARRIYSSLYVVEGLQ